MPICITCSTPVKNLYTTYSKADDRSLGKGVRLTQCPNCKRFADKYVEHDYVVLFIDLVLIKPQVYRHLLFNRLWTPDDALDPSIIRLGILLILFDVYITWARIERTNSPSSLPTSLSTTTATNKISSAPIIVQYLFFLTLNVVATLVQHGVIRTLARILVKPRQDTVIVGGSPRPQTGHSLHHFRSNSSPVKFRGGHAPGSGVAHTTAPSTPAMTTSASTTALDETTPRQSVSLGTVQQAIGQQQSENSLRNGVESRTQAAQQGYSQASPSAISTALLVSSCTKLFPILLVIWPTGGTSNQDGDENAAGSSSMAPFAHRATSYIGWIVLLNNIEALLILLQCGYVAATILAVAGLLSRWMVEGWILSAAGLVRELDGPIGDMISICRWVIGRG